MNSSHTAINYVHILPIYIYPAWKGPTFVAVKKSVRKRPKQPQYNENRRLQRLHNEPLRRHKQLWKNWYLGFVEKPVGKPVEN